MRRIPALPLVRSFLAIVAIAVFCRGTRLAYASWLAGQGTAGQLSLAAALAPYNSGFHFALAQADPLHEKEHLHRALTWKPRSPGALIALSLIAESEGDPRAANELLDRALAADHGFRPVWAKLNLASRRKDQDSFWPAARRAFAMSHRDRRALLDLCWEMRPDGPFLLRHVGLRPPVLFDTTIFLMQQAELAAARRAFAVLADQPYLSLSETNAGRVATADERRQLGMDLCDLHLDRGDAPGAWIVWENLGKKNLRRPAESRGFAWRHPAAEVPGVESIATGGGSILRFNGGQADDVSLLWRYLEPRAPGRYRVTIDLDPAGSLAYPREVTIQPGSPVALEIRYHRSPGTLAFRGAVRVGGVRLEPLPYATAFGRGPVALGAVAAPPATWKALCQEMTFRRGSHHSTRARWSENMGRESEHAL